MPTTLEGMGISLGGQAASGLLDQGMGLLFAAPQRKAQLKTAKGLQDLQIQGSKELTDYNTAKQLQMWKDTSYGAQKEQMKEAGINPALMYGMGGGGGVSNSISPGNVSGQQAGTPKGSGNEGMGIQAALASAQIQNLQEDSHKKRVEANKLEGVDTANVESNTAKNWAAVDEITQNISNAKTQGEVLKWVEQIKKAEANVATQTIGDAMSIITNMAEAGKTALSMLQRDDDINEQTKADKISRIKSESLSAAAEVGLKQSQTGLNQAQITKISAEIANMVIQQGQKWYSLGIDTQRQMMYERLIKFNTAQSQRTYDNILKGVGAVTNALKPININSTTNNTGDKYIDIYNQ